MAGFITRWTVAGGAPERTITLPLTDNGVFNCVVNWGDATADSTVTTFDDADRIHEYAADGTYDVTITGECPSWSFNNGGDKLKIVSIVNWGDAVDFGGFGYLTSGFYGCTNLTNIGVTGKILAKAGLTNVQNAFRTTGITSIPAGILDNCVNVTTNAFYATFAACASLTSIPADLFKFNVSAGSGAFNHCFSTTPIVAVPVDLFRFNTAVSGSVESTFSGCTLLTTVPADTFRYNVNVRGFTNTFLSCNKLQLNKNIFYADGEQNTRFLNKTMNFTGCFSRNSFTGTQGEAPDLWNCNFGTGTVTPTTCFSGAGNTTASISNYDDIPPFWGGPYAADPQDAVQFGAVSIADVQVHTAAPAAEWYTEMVARGEPAKHAGLIHQISQVAEFPDTHYDLLSGTTGALTDMGAASTFVPPTEIGLALGANVTNSTIIDFGTGFKFMQEASHSYDAWVRIDGSGDQCLWANGDENTTDFQGLLYDDATDSLVYACVVGATLRQVSAEIEIGRLYHVAISREYDSVGDTTLLAICIDGEPVEAWSYSGAPVVTNDDFVMLSTSEAAGVFTLPLIGATVGNRFYDEALTLAEIETIYAEESAVITNGPYATQTITPATKPATISGAVKPDGAGGFPFVLVQEESGGPWRAISTVEDSSAYSTFLKQTPVNDFRLATKVFNAYAKKSSYFDALDGGDDPGAFTISLVEVSKNKRKALENLVLMRKPLHSWAVMVVRYV